MVWRSLHSRTGTENGAIRASVSNRGAYDHLTLGRSRQSRRKYLIRETIHDLQNLKNCTRDGPSRRFQHEPPEPTGHRTRRPHVTEEGPQLRPRLIVRLALVKPIPRQHTNESVILCSSSNSRHLPRRATPSWPLNEMVFQSWERFVLSRSPLFESGDPY